MLAYSCFGGLVCKNFDAAVRLGEHRRVSGGAFEFNDDGVVPPVAGEDGGTSDRSPYEVSVESFCRRFGFTKERRELLVKWLDFIDMVRNSVSDGGFLWVNGSFVEDVESLRTRAPADIDLVLFLPMGRDGDEERAFATAHPEIFDQRGNKRRFKVDTYFVNSARDAGRQARQIAYWYSMWAHQRDTNLWKGFFSVPLEDTALARGALDELAGKSQAEDGGTQ